MKAIKNYVGSVLLEALDELDGYLTRELNNRLNLEEFPNAELETSIECDLRVVNLKIVEDQLKITVNTWLNDNDDCVSLTFTISTHAMIFRDNFVNVVSKTINNTINSIAIITELTKEDFEIGFRKANNTMYHTVAELDSIFIDI